MLEQPSSEKELKKSSKGRKRLFMMAVAIVSIILKKEVSTAKLEGKYYDYFQSIQQSTGHVQVKKRSQLVYFPVFLLGMNLFMTVQFPEVDFPNLLLCYCSAS